MNKFIRILLLCVAVSVLPVSCANLRQLPKIEVGAENSLFERLNAIPEISEVRILEPNSHFEERYELLFIQHVDPADENSVYFSQRVLLGHKKLDAPVFVELQGYQIFSESSGELAAMFEGNQITIEHRFFANSKPKSGIPWKYLTVKNAAADQHKIISVLKEAIYSSNRFISTGISKGGQTTMIHRSLYPNDVDASVCYVAPLNFEREDPRIYEFLNSVGTSQQRSQIANFQLMCLKRKELLIKELDILASEKGYTWDVSLEEALELYVLEYSFAFWQWGSVRFEDIPKESDSNDLILKHLLDVSGVSFFESKGVEELRPFFWAALTEMGMYGYQYKPFAEYLSKQEDYLFDFTLPKGIKAEYKGFRMKEVNDFIQNNATNMLFIYGELDTWSATAVELSQKAKNRGLKKYVLNGGHHTTRIKDFREKEQLEIIKILEGYAKTTAIK